MRIAILGSGEVGSTVGLKLARLGHQVMMGSRSTANLNAAGWAKQAGRNASHGTFAEAASFGETAFNCTTGTASIQALTMAGKENLNGKILIDLANTLEFDAQVPTLAVCNTDSLGEQIQRLFPDVLVVKTLNTVNCKLMVDPGLLPGDHNVFMSGNDPGAKRQVSAWLAEWFGWKPHNIIDLGDISTARGPEMLLPLWIALWRNYKTPYYNFHVVASNE